MAPQPSSAAFTMHRPNGYAGNPEARNNKPPPEDLDDDLIKQCREFLAIQIPVSNVVFVDQFAKYMPLFNKNLYEQADTESITELYKEYYGRFSMQHPIQILSRERDDNGVMHPEIRERFRLERTIPATFRRVSSLNDLGEKVPALINAFFNATTQPSGPFDKRKEDYAHAIAQAIDMADAKAGGRKEQEARFAREADNLIHDAQKDANKKATPEQPAETPSALSGLSLWG